MSYQEESVKMGHMQTMVMWCAHAQQKTNYVFTHRITWFRSLVCSHAFGPVLDCVVFVKKMVCCFPWSVCMRIGALLLSTDHSLGVSLQPILCFLVGSCLLWLHPPALFDWTNNTSTVAIEYVDAIGASLVERSNEVRVRTMLFHWHCHCV